jgi:TRAP-type C4-dicarboxylate transport system permease small subunit
MSAHNADGSGAAPLERLIARFELMAGIFIAAVTALTFVSVVLRYVFSWGLPDAFDIARNLLGIVIFWGIALAGYRGDHITVDLLWGALGRRARWAMDIFATLVTLGAMAVFAWMMGGKVLSTWHENVLTFDLHLPVAAFFLVAWLGLVGALPLLLLRLWRIAAGRGHEPLRWP